MPAPAKRLKPPSNGTAGGGGGGPCANKDATGTQHNITNIIGRFFKFFIFVVFGYFEIKAIR